MTDVANVVNVTINTTPTFPQGQGFGLLNIVGNSTTLPIGDRIRFYSTKDMTAIGKDFASNTEEYKAALALVSQNPRPAIVAISRRLSSATAAELLGSLSADQTIGDYSSIVAGGFAITLDGAVKQISGINFAGVANMNAVAALIQTAMTAAAAGSSCVWTGTRFKLTSGTTGGASTITYAVAPAAGTDMSTMMGLHAAGAGIITAGASAESVTQSLQNLALISSEWYGVTLTAEATEQNIKDAAAWTEAQVKMFGCNGTASNNLDASSTVSLGYALKTSGYRRTLATFDNVESYPHVSALARQFAVDYSAENSTITMKFKQLPGMSTLALTETQRLALVGNHMNYYTKFGDSAMFAEGVMASGEYIDQVHALDWLKNNIETNVFGYLLTQPKVPQTDKGVSAVTQRVTVSLAQGQANGLIAPGVWLGAPLGTVNQGDYLPLGYYAYAAPVAKQTQADRLARKSPPIGAIACGAGALHSVAINVNFQP